ncbi:MAG: response regulator transcription factor [Kiritimatiellae bacterium]|nr:response regulator transcription factor [Kiritimatiellia bacterium]
MKKTRIVIVDDHSLMRMGLSSLIASEKDMETVGEAENGKAAVELVRERKPDVVIMDLMMPELSGAEATRIIHGEFPDVKIIILTSFGTSAEMSQAIANGAVGTLMKDTATDDLVATIRAVATGQTVIPEDLLRMSKEDVSTLQLTDHQLEILGLVVKGFTNSDIARHFSVSEVTIKKTLQTAFARIGASNRAEAVSITLKKHLLKD